MTFPWNELFVSANSEEHSTPTGDILEHYTYSKILVWFQFNAQMCFEQVTENRDFIILTGMFLLC
jgi:hypothetical protein